MIKELLKKNMIQLQVLASYWEDAIIKASKPLIQFCYYTQSYLDAMIHQLEVDAAYYVLSEGIAFPHTKIEYGSNKTGLGIMKLKKSVYFKDKAVNYILCFSAVDHVSHLGALSTLLKLIETKKFFSIFESSSCSNKILSQIKEFEDS